MKTGEVVKGYLTTSQQVHSSKYILFKENKKTK
jgi:hypothetical protein